LTAAASVLAACGTVVTPILGYVERLAQRGEQGSLANHVRLHLTCPRCGSEQDCAVGASRCASCQLKIVIDIDEPRCNCGYLLYGLQDSRCPECGREIPQEDRWASA
jgi:hypothetical protein